MLYDSYHKKISRVVDKLRKIFKHIVLISIVLGLLLAFLITFMVTKGIIINDNKISNNFAMVYGEDLPIKASAMFCTPSYQYSTDGVNWSDKMPVEPGEYKVRATANGLFGNKHYGKVYSFVLEPKEIDVSVIEKEIIYGDMPSVTAELCFSDKISCDGFIYADRVAEFTQIKPDQGKIKIANADGEDVTDAYDINTKSTGIKILPRPIGVTVSDQSMIYNDVKFSYDGYELSSGTLASGDTLQAVFDKYLIDVGEVENTPRLSVITSDGIDVSMHYIISTKIGKLTVEHRPLIIKTASATKVYDALELSNLGYEIVGDYGLVEGHTMTCISNSSLTDVDEIENALDFEITNASGDVKTPNYSFFYERGTLSVTARPLNVTFESETAMYDNKEHRGVITLDGLCEGHSAVYKIPTIIDVGVINNETEISEIVDASGKDVFFNYDIFYGEIGVIEITKRPITIETESATIEYDGQTHVFDKFEITSEIKLADGEELDIQFEEFSQAGTYENKAKEIDVISQRSTNYSNSVEIIDISVNYDVTEVVGTVIINKCALTLRPVDTEKVYDATPLVPTDFIIVSGVLPENHVIFAEYKGSITDAGKGDSEIDIEKTTVSYFGNTSDGEDATANFEISSEKGKLTVLKRPLTVSTGSAEKVYDGTPLSSNEWQLIDGSLVEGHTLTIECSSSRVYPGVSDNLISDGSAKIVDSEGKSVFDNYEITYDTGTLTVHKRPIEIKSAGATKVYDGTPLKAEGYEIVDKDLPDYGLLAGHTLVASTNGSITNRGEQENTLEVIIRNAQGEEETDYYEITKTCGMLVINPITVNVTTTSATKIYDGKPLVAKDVTTYTTDVEEKLLEGHTYNITPSDVELVNVPEIPVENTVTLTVYDRYGKDMTALGNYEVVGEWGLINITPRIIKLRPLPELVTKVYDGTPLICENYEDLSEEERDEGLLPEHTIKEIKFTSYTDVVEDLLISVESFTIIDESGENVTLNYSVELVEVYYNITPRNIEIVSDSARKLFDGTPLTAKGYELRGEHSVLSQHTLTVTITGSQLEEGISDNTVEAVVITDLAGEDVTQNYNIKITEGKLEVYKEVVAVINSTKGGYIYLKQKAYGEYNGRGFDEAYSSGYYISRNGYRHNYTLWTQLCLKENENNFPQENLKVTQATQYMLPYYYYLGGENCEYPSYTSEEYIGSAVEYEVPYFDYCFEINGTEDINLRRLPANFNYYVQWANDEYTLMSISLKNSLRNAIGAEKFDEFAAMDTEELIKEVAQYMRFFGTYTYSYDRSLDSSTNMALDFFRTYKQGVCVHYATAATMLYRALGVPARYVEGYVVDAEAATDTAVKDAHAWVEVLIENLGWVQVEVTPGFGGFDDRIDITLKPKDATKVYDGEAFTSPEELEVVEPSDAVKELINLGYKFVATEFTEGSYITYPGETESSVLENKVKIYDENGKDVTYKFNINTDNQHGTVTVEKIKIPFEIYLYPTSKTYDGKAIEYSNSYSIIDPELAEAVANGDIEFFFAFNYSDSNCHSLKASEALKYISYRIVDKRSEVSAIYEYTLVIKNKYAQSEAEHDYVISEIKPRNVTISSASVEAYYNDGDVLSNSECFISSGTLADGHTFEAVVTAELTTVGSMENTIESCVIYDANGTDVTKNYTVTLKSGILTFVSENAVA